MAAHGRKKSAGNLLIAGQRDGQLSLVCLMAYVPRKGKSPDTIHKIRDELDTVLAGAASRTMQRVAGLRNEELSEAASPGHVRATALVKQLQSGDVESAVDQLVNLVQYMDIRKAMFDAGAI